jgi:hypothetical protein
MGYNMKGFSGFGNSPAKQKVDLTKKPNPTTKAVHRDPEEESPTEIEMQNKGDFNISNLHKDTKISLDKKKKKKHPLGIEDPAELEKLYKKTENPNNKGHKKIMKDGSKNKVHGAGNTGNWQPHQFRK